MLSVTLEGIKVVVVMVVVGNLSWDGKGRDTQIDPNLYLFSFGTFACLEGRNNGLKSLYGKA